MGVPPPPPPLLQPHGRFNAQQIQTRAHGDGAGFAQQNASVFHRTAQHPAISGKRGDGPCQFVQVGAQMVGHQGLAKQFQDVGQFAQLQHQGLFRGFVARHQQSGVAPQNGPRVLAALWGEERNTFR